MTSTASDARDNDSVKDVTIGPNDLLRFLLELFAFVSLAAWGFTTWSLPLSIVFGLLAPALAILLWALFLSPRAVIALDPFGKALVEIVLMASAAFAWVAMDLPIVAGVFAAVAVVSGIISGRKAYS